MWYNLICFLAAITAPLIPGVGLAAWLRLGASWFDRIIYGCTLGLALAIWLASGISHLNLTWFYPLWIILGLAMLVGLIRLKGAPRPSSWALALIPVVALVAITRYAVALPQYLPRGWDPTFHLILAKKIQLAQHAIFDWSPFEPTTLNYPTGSHTLLVVLAAISHLPLQVVFNDLIPFLGILTTAQLYIFARNATSNDAAALFASIAYGLWAGYGSIDYYAWGGLPNELGMLMLIAALSLWLSPAPLPLLPPLPVLRQFRHGGVRALLPSAPIALLLAAMVLSHHHVMLVAAAIILPTLLISRASPKLILSAAALAALLDLFFLLPYATHLLNINSTHVLQNGEPPIPLSTLPALMGWSILAFAALGVALSLRRQATVNTIVPIACAMLILLYITCEYLWPLYLSATGRPRSTAFTPSRFPTDLNYFLAIYCGLSVSFLLRKFSLRPTLAFLAACLLGLTEIPEWRSLTDPPDVSPGFVRACAWIQQNTPPQTLVYNNEAWTTYLTWRQTMLTPVPVSEPLAQPLRTFDYTHALLAGQAAPTSPDLIVLRVASPDEPIRGPILWTDPSGVFIEKLWPLPVKD